MVTGAGIPPGAGGPGGGPAAMVPGEAVRVGRAAAGLPAQGPLPARPFVLPRGRYDELFETAATLLTLVRRAVLALGPTWPERLVALGADPADHPPHSGLETVETECCALLAGADFLVGTGGPRLLGLDTGGTLGSHRETGVLTRAWQRAAAAPPEGPLFGHDPRTVRAAALADLCARRGLPRTVALIGPGFHPDELRELRAHGFIADLLPGTGARDGPDRRSYALGLFGGAPTTAGGAAALPKAYRAGLLLPQPSSALLADKRALALVSEGLPWMTRGERALVERRLPWTRITLAGRTTWHGTERDLPGLVLEEPERFVLKRAVAGSGPVLAGHATEPAVWAAAVRRAFGLGDSVVQEYVRPAPHPVELSDGTAAPRAVRAAAPVLSPLLFAGRPGGCRVSFPALALPASGAGPSRLPTGLPADAVLAGRETSG
ncbi:hypothetical protein [Streptomyces sp. WMMB303]|uniref:hypothetical protein n=1 Tax=Streptomyces sp. WMMB303 TaxID=3034154 RepID=UPI0023EC4A14|nr:hypothetical protein [Streptomyces sp. WMMB303]MDF4249992.1 hypothetical protein [Streptomyces sp. WMMB303]